MPRVTPEPTTERHPQVREYGCVKCQKHHRQYLDPEYDDHLFWQNKHGWRERPALPWEVFALEMQK